LILVKTCLQSILNKDRCTRVPLTSDTD